jgi:hypothetical protein
LSNGRQREKHLFAESTIGTRDDYDFSGQVLAFYSLESGGPVVVGVIERHKRTHGKDIVSNVSNESHFFAFWIAQKMIV